MRRRWRKSAAGEAGVDMTPMLDIVFIMLIFFIVTAVFLDERGIALAEAPDSPETNQASPPAILVQLDADDMAFVDGQRAALGSVTSRVEAQFADKPGASVILQADAAASVDAVVRLKDDFTRREVPVVLKVEAQSAVNAR